MKRGGSALLKYCATHNVREMRRDLRGRRALILFGFVFTFTRQAQGAPIIDRCGGKTREGKRWKGYAVHLAPWRKDRYGDRLIGTAFCVGRLLRGLA